MQCCAMLTQQVRFSCYQSLYKAVNWQLFIFYLWQSTVWANERRRYICNVFSHWLRLCSAIDRKWAHTYMTSFKMANEILQNLLAKITVKQTVKLLMIWDALMFMWRHCNDISPVDPHLPIPVAHFPTRCIVDVDVSSSAGVPSHYCFLPGASTTTKWLLHSQLCEKQMQVICTYI